MKHWTIIILILFWLSWHLAVPVDLTRTDLGRHIKNGELILHGNWDVLYKNYYSYTNPEYPFINHHWLFGVFCYVLWHYFGFTGLSLIYLGLELFTFYVFFRCWQRYSSSFAISCAFALLSFPLITNRSEIRPEAVSYLFCGIYWSLIDLFQQKRLKSGHLIIVLCALQIIWVNTHIFFIMGPILTGIFWLQAHCNKEEQQASILKKLFWLLLAMCLINPSGINGFLVPFHIDKAYLLPISENLSVIDVFKAKMVLFNPVVLYFLASLGMSITALFFILFREGFKKYIFIGMTTLLLSLAALKSIRLIALYGYFWIPLSTYVFSRWVELKTDKYKKYLTFVLVTLGVIFSASFNFNLKQKPSFGIVPGSNDAAEFFNREKISGPIFNDYDIGGYLIFNLYPQHKLFVDNRMEAFPKDFMKNTYEPTQWNEGVWHKIDQNYHFNVIFMSLEPYNPWWVEFIVHRFEDKAWAPVFMNDKAIIFIKRNKQNAQLISRDELRADKIIIKKPSGISPTMFTLFY